MGTFASRSVTVGGSALLLACREARARLDVGEQPPFETSARFELPGPVFSFGCYVASVEIDRTTGELTLHKVVAVDDCGRVVNPLLAEGQVVGAAVQAVGECLFEQVGYDADGQPLRGMEDMQRLMVGDVIGRTVPVRVFRGGRLLSLDVTPVELTT